MPGREKGAQRRDHGQLSTAEDRQIDLDLSENTGGA